MKIFPAIDLKNGKCVRLTKGDFKSEKIYNENPINQAEIFSNAGFKYLHIIDLDGALEGNLVNLRVIKEIVKKFNFKVEVGGGIRSEDSIAKLLDIGSDKIILGTAAIKNKPGSSNAGGISDKPAFTTASTPPVAPATAEKAPASK